MQTHTANEAKTSFGEFSDRVQREPVRVMRHNRVIDRGDGERGGLRGDAGFYAGRLRASKVDISI